MHAGYYGHRFDPQFGSQPQARRLLDDYAVPEYFREDLLQHIGPACERPPFRWFLAGGARSGSPIHKARARATC